MAELLQRVKLIQLWSKKYYKIKISARIQNVLVESKKLNVETTLENNEHNWKTYASLLCNHG